MRMATSRLCLGLTDAWVEREDVGLTLASRYYVVNIGTKEVALAITVRFAMVLCWKGIIKPPVGATPRRRQRCYVIPRLAGSVRQLHHVII